MLRKLQRYLLEGLVVAGPIGVTVWILAWVFRRLDGILGNYLGPALGGSAPGLGLVALLLLLIVTGWLTERTLGRRLTDLGGDVISRIPLARGLYRGSKRILQAVLRQDRVAFQEAVLLEYPSAGLWSVAFVTGPAPGVAPFDEPGATLFLPTAPNPMSGYLIVVPRSKLRSLGVTPEEAFTYVLSAGSVSLDQAAAVLAEEDGGVAA